MRMHRTPAHASSSGAISPTFRMANIKQVLWIGVKSNSRDAWVDDGAGEGNQADSVSCNVRVSKLVRRRQCLCMSSNVLTGRSPRPSPSD